MAERFRSSQHLLQIIYGFSNFSSLVAVLLIGAEPFYFFFLVEGHPSNIRLKFERNWPKGIRGVGI